jgi:hypothetical protein
MIFVWIFWIISAGAVAALMFMLPRFIKRKKLVQEILALPIEARFHLITSEKQLVRLFNIGLWLFIVVLIILPISFFYFLRPVFIPGTICMALMTGGTLYEFLFRKWLVTQIEKDSKQNTNLQ